MAHDVFISHSTKDKTTADAVCAMLESSGVRCWIAPRDVTPGLQWSECIIEAIKECRIMVLVFTTHANESPQIGREVERAVNHGVVILPFRVEDIVPSSALEYFIGNVHWLDALNPPLEAHLKSLSGTVKMLLARMQPRAAVQPKSPIEPVSDMVPKPDIAKPEQSPEAKPNPPEESPKWPFVAPVAEPTAGEPPKSKANESAPSPSDGPRPRKRSSAVDAIKAPWQFSDTMMDAGVSKSHPEDETLNLKMPAVEATFQTLFTSQQGPVSQPPHDAPLPATTESYRGASTLGNISTVGSALRIKLPAIESTPSRWRFNTSRILIACVAVASVSAIGLVYWSSSKRQDSAAQPGQDQTSILPATQSSTSDNVDQPENEIPAEASSDDGNGGARKSPIQTLQASCDRGIALDCSRLADKYSNGLGITKDETRAVQLYQKGCDGGDAYGCTDLGFMYGAGKGVEKDDSRAFQFSQKGCDGGNGFACNNLGAILVNGDGVPKDESRAAQLYQKGCDAGAYDGCKALGMMYESGLGVEKDENLAAKFYQKGCEGNVPGACTNLGDLFSNGQGVAVDKSHAHQLYQKACDLGDTVECAFANEKK